jgi:pimeloyl-ACP methyl ester carboxylesterase
MLVTGSGEATVILENGVGGPLENWGLVQPAVSQFARTVSYDRAGVGLSEKGPLPRDGRRIATELHEALRAAAIQPPYVMVGASFGGPYVRIFTAMYPDEVSAMVLVDPTADTIQREGGSTSPELRAWTATQDQARASVLPARLPVYLIDAISPVEVPFATEAVRRLRAKNRAEIEAESLEYKRWLAGIPNGHLIVTTRSGHNVMLEEPGLVVTTIRAAVLANH